MTDATTDELKKVFLRDARILRNAYWFIRWERYGARIRHYYRVAKKEKAALAALGYDDETIRLYRLHLCDPHCEKREKRFLESFERPFQYRLF